ncbi:MAG: lysophospholipid acyltransferase family protein [Spirochaetia bacterium]
MVSRYFFKVLRRLFFNAHLSGLENLRTSEPFILVANHAGAFGPVSVITSIPLRIYPWVAYEVTDLKTVAPRIQAEFVEQELRLRPPLSVYLGKVIGRVCVALMKDIGAIPVYQKSKAITRTVMRSLALLQQGKNILVFAEDSTKIINDVLCEFCTGFIHVARLYYQSTKKAVQFLPVAVNRRVGRILVGAPIRFDGTVPFTREKQRLKCELETSVYSLYKELESDVPAPTRR